MKHILLIMTFISIHALYGQITIDNRSTQSTFIDKVTLLTYNGIEHVPNIKEINMPIAPQQTITQQKLIGSTKNPIVQLILVHNNVTYLFNIPAEQQSGSIIITRDNQVVADGAIQLAEQRSLHHPQISSSWGIRKL